MDVNAKAQEEARFALLSALLEEKVPDVSFLGRKYLLKMVEHSHKLEWPVLFQEKKHVVLNAFMVPNLDDAQLQHLFKLALARGFSYQQVFPYLFSVTGRDEIISEFLWQCSSSMHYSNEYLVLFNMASSLKAKTIILCLLYSHFSKQNVSFKMANILNSLETDALRLFITLAETDFKSSDSVNIFTLSRFKELVLMVSTALDFPTLNLDL